MIPGLLGSPFTMSIVDLGPAAQRLADLVARVGDDELGKPTPRARGHVGRCVPPPRPARAARRGARGAAAPPPPPPAGGPRPRAGGGAARGRRGGGGGGPGGEGRPGGRANRSNVAAPLYAATQ